MSADHVLVAPDRADSAFLDKITVNYDGSYHISGTDKDFVIQNIKEILQKFGIVKIVGISNDPELFALLGKALSSLYPNDSREYRATFINEQHADGSTDFGDQCKLIHELDRSDPALKYMLAVMHQILPNHTVVEGMDDKGRVLLQSLLNQLEPPPERLPQQQAPHLDGNIIHTRCGDQHAEGILRQNVHCAREGGLLSWFLPFEDQYALCVYPGLYRKARVCMEHFSNHYKAMKASWAKRHKGQDTLAWQTFFMSSTVEFLRNQFPGDAPVIPVSIPARKGEVLIADSFLVHSGLSVKGKRGFLLTREEVKCMHCYVWLYLAALSNHFGRHLHIITRTIRQK